MSEIPVARGQRIDWESAAPSVRRAVEEFLGDRVVRATTEPRGFSPAVAARLETATGRRAFLKAVAPDVNRDAPHIYPREIEVASRLPEGIPAPRLLWSLDEGAEGWVALLFEEVAGRNPELPWRAPDLGLALEAIDELGEVLTPSPLREGQQGERMARDRARWSTIAASPPESLEPWFRERAGDLARREERLAELTAGDTLVHLDIRSDNLLIGDGRCWVVDWAWPLMGAAWMDVVLFAVFAESEGGPEAGEVLRSSRAGRSAPAEGVITLVATIAGGLTFMASQPALPGLPSLRPFQAAHARTARTWLRRLLDSR